MHEAAQHHSTILADRKVEFGTRVAAAAVQVQLCLAEQGYKDRTRPCGCICNLGRNDVLRAVGLALVEEEANTGGCGE
jgi:hypothetical protein